MMLDPHDELLSAYLDGEVTAEEKAAVEQRLAGDAVYRQSYEDLRAQRTAIRTLPRYRAPRELAGLVTERVNQEAPVPRRAATATAASTAAPPSADQGEPERMASPAVALGDRLRQRLTARALFWPALAIAAALLVMFQSPKKPDAERNLAQAPTKSIPAGNLVAGPSKNGNRETSPKAIAADNSAAESVADAQRSGDQPIDAAINAASRSENQQTASSRQSQPALQSQAMKTATVDESLRQSIRRGEVVVVECTLPNPSSSAFAELLENHQIQFDSPQHSSNATEQNAPAILVKATPATIMSLIADLTNESSGFAHVTIHAGSSQRKAFAVAGSPLPDNVAESPASPNNKPTLKPQAATVEKSASEPSPDDTDAGVDSARLLTLPATEVFAAVQEGQNAGAKDEVNTRARPTATDAMSVIFVLNKQAEEPSAGDDAKE